MQEEAVKEASLDRELVEALLAKDKQIAWHALQSKLEKKERWKLKRMVAARDKQIKKLKDEIYGRK